MYNYRAEPKARFLGLPPRTPIELILMRGSKFLLCVFSLPVFCNRRLNRDIFCKNSLIIFSPLFSPDSCISQLLFPAHGLSLHNPKVRGLPTTHTLNIPSQFLALTTSLLGFYTSCGKTTLFTCFLALWLGFTPRKHLHCAKEQT